MKTVNQVRHKVNGDTRTTKFITTKTASWTRIPTYWQLPCGCIGPDIWRSEEHTSELQSLMRISYAVFCLKKKITHMKEYRLKKYITYSTYYKAMEYTN